MRTRNSINTCKKKGKKIIAMHIVECMQSEIHSHYIVVFHDLHSTTATDVNVSSK